MLNQMLNGKMRRVLHNRCKHRQNPPHRGYGYGIHAGAGIRHRTRTRVTRGLKTAGLPIPVRNPTSSGQVSSSAVFPLCSGA